MEFFTYSFSSVIVLSFEPVMMSAMQNFFATGLTSGKHYLLMCLLLSSPDRLPYSTAGILVTGFIYYILGLLLVDAEHSYALICAQITLELVTLALISYVGLNLRNSLPRFQQTFSALIGTNAIITAVSIAASRNVTANGNIDENLLIFVALALMIWNVAVLSLIFKRSFETSTHLSAMISFSFFILFQITVYWLFS